MKKERKGRTNLRDIGLTLTAAGALIGGSFLGAVSASVESNTGTYALETLPDFYGSSDFSNHPQIHGQRQAQYYYDYCYYTSDGDYCCYYYGYYYCYDSDGKTSENLQNDFGGFAGSGSPAEPPANNSAFY